MAVLLSTKAHTMQDWKAALLAVDPGLEILTCFPTPASPPTSRRRWSGRRTT